MMCDWLCGRERRGGVRGQEAAAAIEERVLKIDLAAWRGQATLLVPGSLRRAQPPRMSLLFEPGPCDLRQEDWLGVSPRQIKEAQAAAWEKA
jgi:hypothetical protein